MTKREIKSLDRLKQDYLFYRSSAEEVFNLPSYKYDEIDECKRRLADRHYGYAEGIYQALVLLGQAEGLPEVD